MPESMHMVMWAMSDRTHAAQPAHHGGLWRAQLPPHQCAGESTFVKFHWRPKLGIQSTVWDEAMKLQAADNDFHRRDLFEAIEAGDFPEWELSVQLFTEEDAERFPSTTWTPPSSSPRSWCRQPHRPHGAQPLARQLFAETEQVAFAPPTCRRASTSERPIAARPPVFVPGHAALAPGRAQLCADPDQRAQVPVPPHAARWPHADAGAQRPRELRAQQPAGRHAARFAGAGLPPLCAGRRWQRPGQGRIRPESFADHYSQARMFYRSQSPLEQAHMASALVFELSKVETPHVREAVVGHLLHVDADWPSAWPTAWVCKRCPRPATRCRAGARPALSPALRIIDRMKPTLQGRCIGILVADGSNGTTVANLRKALEKAGATVKIVAPKVGGAVLKDGTLLPADGQLQGTPSVVFDAVASIPVARHGRATGQEGAAVDWFRDAFGHLKAIAACKGTQAILQAGGIEPDAGVVAPADAEGFIAAAQPANGTANPKSAPRPDPSTTPTTPQGETMSKARYDSHQLNDLVLQMMETELGGEQVYRTALTCAVNPDLKKNGRLSARNPDPPGRGAQPVRHLGLDPTPSRPRAGWSKHIGESLVKAMQLAKARGAPPPPSWWLVNVWCMQKPKTTPTGAAGQGGQVPRAIWARP